MHLARRRAVMAGLALSLAGLAVGTVPAAAATTVRYPSAACPDTGPKGLQECIDAQAAGSTVVLVDEVIDEYAVITKSLTLRGESRRFRPILRGIVLADVAATSPLRVTISDVRVRRELRGIGLDDVGGHRVIIRRVELGRDETHADGMNFSSRVPMTLVVEDSWVHPTTSQTSGIAFHTNSPSGTSHVRIAGNRVSQAGSAIGGSGISVSMAGSSRATVDVYGNSVFAVARSRAGGASGILIHLDDVARADVDVVGNSVARSATSAFMLWNSVDAGGRIRLNLFDNTFSHSDQGITITHRTLGTGTVRSGHNNTYRNARGHYYEGRGEGPGDLHRDPRFVDLDAGDLRLRAGSPLIDRGLVCQPGGLGIRDAAGRHRVAGGSVDIGAFEHGSRVRGGVVVMGSSGRDALRGSRGADIVCGLGGADVLCVRDGIRGNDFVDGGSGRDRGRVDAGDKRRSVEATGGC